MRITDGNLFEGMRFILPEHRHLMEERQAEEKRRRPPELSEDAWAEMAYLLQEAAVQHQPVRLILFAPEQEEIVEGTPQWEEERLLIHTPDGQKISVQLQRLLRVEQMGSIHLE
ncbi:MAG: YolD-like family protein [Firmicutes bacterium]|nr:YolD-like family protein [Bacillota bacterium]